MLSSWIIIDPVNAKSKNSFPKADNQIRQSLQWRHNRHDGVSNRQLHQCLLNRLFERRSKKTSKLRVTGLCVENSPVTGEFLAQWASNVENVSISLRHHGKAISPYLLARIYISQLELHTT